MVACHTSTSCRPPRRVNFPEYSKAKVNKEHNAFIVFFLFNDTDTLSKDHVVRMCYLCFNPNTLELCLMLIFWLQHDIYHYMHYICCPSADFSTSHKGNIIQYTQNCQKKKKERRDFFSQNFGFKLSILRKWSELNVFFFF